MTTTIEFNRSGNRNMGKYLTSELVQLAKLRYEELIRHNYDNRAPDDVRKSMDLLVSLERFELADYGHVKEDGRWSGWGWVLSEKGAEALEARRPMRYGCLCPYAIRLPCVCSESTYCPNPDHTGNGCHGTHD